MSMQYCEGCDKMIDTDYYEFFSERICMKCHLNGYEESSEQKELTSKQEDLILAREGE